jgi:hypothetical protein
MKMIDSRQSGGRSVTLAGFAGIISDKTDVSTQVDLVEEFWQLADARALRLLVIVNHESPSKSYADSWVWDRDQWVSVGHLGGVDMGEDKHVACERLRRLAAVILGDVP